jgi:hypothetical protein
MAAIILATAVRSKHSAAKACTTATCTCFASRSAATVSTTAILTRSGPLWVRGGVRVVSADDFQYEIRNRVYLCRCGVSKDKPFCDGSRAVIEFRDGLQP